MARSFRVGHPRKPSSSRARRDDGLRAPTCGGGGRKFGSALPRELFCGETVFGTSAMCSIRLLEAPGEAHSLGQERSPDLARLTSSLFWLENRSVAESSAGAGVPGRSREQRLRALEQANEVRPARAELKKELAAG